VVLSGFGGEVKNNLVNAITAKNRKYYGKQSI
jgi:hypothetical protein